MLPAANIHLKDLYDNTVDFLSASLQNSSILLRGFLQTGEEGPNPDITSDTDTIAKLNRKSSSVRERVDAVERGTTSAEPLSSSQPMRRELDVTKNELSRSQGEVARLEERCRLLEKTVRETKEMLRARDNEMEKLRRDREGERPILRDRRRSSEQSRDKSSLHDTIQEDQEDNQNGYSQTENGEHAPQYTNGQRRESGESVRQIPNVQRRESGESVRQIPNGQRRDSEESIRTSSNGHRRAEEMLKGAAEEEERAQHRGLETFLTKTDLWSGVQIIQAVQDLNTEVLQFAASATELCAFEKTPRSKPSAQPMIDTTSRLGPDLTRILASRDHAQDPILVQLALQGSISMCIARALSLFCVGLQTKSDAVFSQIYSLMYSSEPQPTSSRWRALTHRYIHNLHPNVADYAVNDLVENILRWSADVFIVSGCMHHGPPSSLRDGLRNRFGSQVHRIAKAACKLAKVTREDIMSTNFEVIAYDQGTPYETKGMSDAFGDFGGSKGSVLCTTELGLRCSTRRSPLEPGKGMEYGSTEQRLLLRPKVVLETMVDVLDPR